MNNADPLKSLQLREVVVGGYDEIRSSGLRTLKDSVVIRIGRNDGERESGFNDCRNPHQELQQGDYVCFWPVLNAEK